LPEYGGGGSNRFASGWSLLTSVNRSRWRWQNRATSCVPYPESPANTNVRSGNRPSSTRNSRHMS
jgi:phage terminase large subunit-like protein